MKGNPYTSETFETIWSNHYCKNSTIERFACISGVKFTKAKFWPLYVNLGKNFTNGLSYRVNTSVNDLKGKVVLIYDVPSYFEVNQQEDSSIRLTKVRQYEGYYGDLSAFKSIDDVLNANFSSSKSRYNFRRSLKQLSEAVDLKCDLYYGNIDKARYNQLMLAFKDLLNKRFDDKNVFNTVLPMWDFFTDLIYDMILEKRVVMNVLSNGDLPIAMSINFVDDASIYVAIRTFDIDYNKLNIGNIEIYKLIEWCLDRGIKIIDFSKGESYYKKRWTNTQYEYEFHILYDAKSFKSRLIGKTLASFFRFKQYLREKNVNTIYVKLKQIKKRLLRQD